MGMFDRPKLFEDEFKEGEAFTLEDAKIGPEIPTEYGPTRPALLKIVGVWYSAIGQGLTAQVEAQDNSDLPARVAMVRVATKSGRKVKRIVPVDSEGQPQLGDDDIPF